MTIKVQPVRVDFSRNTWDKKLSVLHSKRFTRDVIATHTGLTVGQVNYRVYRYLQSERDTLRHRQGRSDEAKMVLARIDKMLKSIKQMKNQVSEHQTKLWSRRMNDFSRN